jgi:hypothetical protein
VKFDYVILNLTMIDGCVGNNLEGIELSLGAGCV